MMVSYSLDDTLRNSVQYGITCHVSILLYISHTHWDNANSDMSSAAVPIPPPFPNR